MTRKDYTALAATLNAQLTVIDDIEARDKRDGRNRPEAMAFGRLAVAGMAERMAQVFEADNPRFDRDRFFKAVHADA